MPTSNQPNPSTQENKEHISMPDLLKTNTSISNSFEEHSMDYHGVNFLSNSTAQSTGNVVIVRNKDGVDIEQSLRNVSNMASSWYASSTRQLYAVLGQCYELYSTIESSNSSERDRYRDDVKAAYKSLNGAQGANTMLGRIISVVFNFADLDRRQRSRYGSVIKAARDAQNKPADADEFVSWLERTGGIVAALDAHRGKGKDKPEQSEINEAVRAMPAKAVLSVPNTGNRFVVLLAQPVDANTVEVLYQFEEDTVGDLLATKAFKAQKASAKEAEQRITAADAADKLASENVAKEMA